MITKERAIRLISTNSFELIATYLLEHRPQNTIIQSTNLISLLQYHTQARVIMFDAARDFYLKALGIAVLADNDSKILKYF